MNKNYIKNAHGKIVESRFIQIKDFVENYLSDDKYYNDAKDELLRQVAYGNKKMLAYEKEHDLVNIPKIYNLEDF